MNGHFHISNSGKKQTGTENKCWCNNPTERLIWVRCTGCNFRYEALKSGKNIGYYHDHENHITGGTAIIEKDVVTEQSTCTACKNVIFYSKKQKEWFHEDGYVECQINTPVAKPGISYRKINQ